MWQRPLSIPVTIHDPIWYEPRRVGHNPLESFMKILCEEANLVEKIYTNHSIRATCISKLDRAGFEARHITALSGHICESTVKEYAVRCPENKKRAMFDALVLKPKQMKREPTATSTSTAAETPRQDPEQERGFNFQIADMPNFDNINLEEMETIDEKALLEALMQTEKYLEQQSKENKKETPDENQQENRNPNIESANTTTSKPQEKNPVAIPNTTNVTTFEQNNLMRHLPVAPRMFFSNSNVTINYNIRK